MFAFGAFLLFWALNIFFLAADYIINQHAPFFLVLRFVIFRIPQAIPMAFPFACLFAALLAMGRLMGDNEVTAMRTAGIPIMRIALSPLVFGFAMFLVAYTMNEWVAPASVDLSTRTFYQIIYHTDSLPVEPQFFRKDPDTGNTFYVGQVAPDNKTMLDVQIFKPAQVRPVERDAAGRSADVQGSLLDLHDVIDTRYNNDGFLTNQQHVKSVTIGLPLGETAPSSSASEQRSVDDEQQVTAHASQRAPIPRHRRDGDGEPADQSRQQAGVAVRVFHRRHRGPAAGTAFRQARTHARHRAGDHRILRLLSHDVGLLGIRP